MTKIFVLSFTEKGFALANRVANALDNAYAYKTSYKAASELVAEAFQTGSALIFIGASGIAVRAIAPHVKSKTSDPAVIVIDELGRFAIPILSGHIGGANRLTKNIAELLGATPVITTATDINGVFSVDTFASENGYVISNSANIKQISARLLKSEKVGLCSEFEIEPPLPENITTEACEAGIYIGTELKSPFEITLNLMPKLFHIGIGTKKNMDCTALAEFVSDILKKNNIPPECVASVSSIDLKKDELAIIKLANSLGVSFITYTAEKLSTYGQSQSEFVKSVTGAGNVCEASAYLSSGGGKIILKKTAREGKTISIAKKAWRVTFENTNDWA